MGELAALLAASAWAAGFVMLRAVPVRHRIFNLNALRMWGPACIYIVILVVLGWVPRFRELTWVNYAALSATVITGIGFSDLVMLRAMRVIGASRAYAIGGIAPLFTVLFAWLILSEEINRLVEEMLEISTQKKKCRPTSMNDQAVHNYLFYIFLAW